MAILRVLQRYTEEDICSAVRITIVLSWKKESLPAIVVTLSSSGRDLIPLSEIVGSVRSSPSKHVVSVASAFSSSVCVFRLCTSLSNLIRPNRFIPSGNDPASDGNKSQTSFSSGDAGIRKPTHTNETIRIKLSDFCTKTARAWFD